MEKIREIKKIKTQFICGKCENLFDKINVVLSGYIVCWLNYEVLFGRIRNKDIEFYNNQTPDFKKHLLKLKAFNEQEEMHIWRSGDKFKYRYVKDIKNDEIESEETEYIDAKQVMFGTKFKKLNDDFYEAFENRGIKYIVPGEIVKCNEGRLILHTRNYIGYNEIGQAGFIDSRFMKIEFEGD